MTAVADIEPSAQTQVKLGRVEFLDQCRGAAVDCCHGLRLFCQAHVPTGSGDLPGTQRRPGEGWWRGEGRDERMMRRVIQYLYQGEFPGGGRGISLQKSW